MRRLLRHQHGLPELGMASFSCSTSGRQQRDLHVSQHSNMHMASVRKYHESALRPLHSGPKAGPACPAPAIRNRTHAIGDKSEGALLKLPARPIDMELNWHQDQHELVTVGMHIATYWAGVCRL